MGFCQVWRERKSGEVHALWGIGTDACRFHVKAKLNGNCCMEAKEWGGLKRTFLVFIGRHTHTHPVIQYEQIGTHHMYLGYGGKPNKERTKGLLKH